MEEWRSALRELRSLCVEFLAELAVCFPVKPGVVASFPNGIRFLARKNSLYAWYSEKCATAHGHVCSR